MMHSRLIAITRTLGLSLAFLSCPTLRADTINVLMFTDPEWVGWQPLAIRAASNETTTFKVTTTSSLESLTKANLAKYDLFYAAWNFGYYLNKAAPVLEDYLATRGGIVVGEMGEESRYKWLPRGLSVIGAYSESHSPNASTNALTPAGLAHPIFAGLSARDLQSPPADTIELVQIWQQNLDPGWTVLATNTEGISVAAAVAVGEYRSHRILLWPMSLSSGPDSDLIRQALVWTAGTNPVPEPSTTLLITIGFLAIMARGTYRRSSWFRSREGSPF